MPRRQSGVILGAPLSGEARRVPRSRHAEFLASPASPRRAPVERRRRNDDEHDTQQQVEKLGALTPVVRCGHCVCGSQPLRRQSRRRAPDTRSVPRGRSTATTSTPPGDTPSSVPSTGAGGGEHVGTAVRGRRRPSGTPEHGFVAHVNGVRPEPSRTSGARGDSPTCGHRPDRPTDERGPSRNPESEESECEHHHHADERETTRPTGESPGPQERAHVLRTGLNVSHGQGRRAAWHCERPGAQERGHRTRQNTPHDQDTCRVCSRVGHPNVWWEWAVCVRRTAAQGGWGAGMYQAGGPYI